MSIITPKVLKGFRDFLPESEMLRKDLIYKLEKVFRSFGFVPIDTPILEYTEVLLGKGGGETDKQVYRFLDNGKRDVSMRFDLTVPFARYVAANRNNLYMPFKRFHINKVWRGENTQRGRYREFMQCDFDMVGVDSAAADFEILMMMHDSFKALEVGKFTFHLSHRGLFNLLLETRNIQDNSVEILRTIDKLAKIGPEKVTELLSEFISEKDIQILLEYVNQRGDFPTILSKLEELSGGPSEESKRMWDIWNLIQAADIGDFFKLDPSITRGLDYYTGIVYETFLDQLPEIGSVCSGGRYNNLASLYTNEELPGVGSSIGLDRLLAGMEILNAHINQLNSSDVLIFCMDEKLFPHYFKMAKELRENGLNVEVYPTAKKINQQFKFAENKKIPFALICGESEYEAGTINLKNLQNRENFEGISLKDAILKLK